MEIVTRLSSRRLCGWLAIVMGLLLYAAPAKAGEQACCQFNSDDRTCFDDIIGSGLSCPAGNGLGEGTTCAADCNCTDTCGTCVGKQAGNLSLVEVQLLGPPVFNGTNTVYRYRVCQIAGHDISNWVLGLPDTCCSRIVSATGARTTGTCGVDPSTGLFGLKFETSQGVPQCSGDCGPSGSVFTITLSGNATSTGCVKTAHKANGDENTSSACIVGPSAECGGFCTTDSQCNDGIPCTIDDCDPANPAADASGCVHVPDDVVCNDSNPCTDERCVPGSGCLITPNDGNTCRNNLFCDGNEVCVAGACQPGAPPCNDGVACTTNQCNEATDSCTFTPNGSLCSDGLFCNGVETCDPVSGCRPGTQVDCSHLNGACAVGHCNESQDSCEAKPINNGQTCDDGLFCTSGEACVAGQCVGLPKDCGDGIGCTNDSCDEVINQCVRTENDSKCDNGLFCDGAEICEPTNPAADLVTGCFPGTTPCTNCPCAEDSDSCTSCICPDVPCPDAPECRVSLCDNGNCLYPPAPAGTSCGDDGISCTTESCDGNGQCVHAPDPTRCTADADPCTDTICHPVSGCIHVPDDTNTCDDGLFCTVGDRCVGGVCTGTPNACDDGVACTGDVCDEAANRCVNAPNDGQCPSSSTPCFSYICHPVSGCTVVNHDGAACTDGLVCTGNDRCEGGLCVGDPTVCDDAIACTVDSCSEKTGACVFAPQHTLCNDNQLCTDDVCVPGSGCVFTPDNTNSCKHASFCNGVEICVDGLCEAGDSPCGDGVVCTADVCNELKDVCAYVPDDRLCSDGVFCNGAEVCHRKKGCQAGAPPVCNDGIVCSRDFCNPVSDECEYVFDVSCDDGLFCNGVEVCDPVNGCQDGPDPVCDDGLACTRSLCNPQLNACEHVPDDSLCSNGLFCDGTEVCDPLLGCVPGTPPDCDDDVTCTIDSCDEPNDACLHVPDNNFCSDDKFCTGEESCDPVLDCQPGIPPCPAGLICDEDNNICVECVSDEQCNDSLRCNGRHECIDRVCVFFDPPSCDDQIACTVDRCDPVTDDCVHAPDDFLCNNGLFCDGVEVCNPLTGCQPGIPVDCNDDVTCTNDLCVEAQDQCTHTPKDTQCDDGLFCNGAEVCHPTQGCLPGTPPSCVDSSNCTVDTCNEANDNCDHACPAPGITCIDREFECDAVGEFPPPVISDNCSLSPLVNCTEQTTPGKLPQEFTVTRVCTVTNDCGRGANCQQVIEVVDTTPPQVTCPPDKRFECDAIGDSGQPIVSDNCDPDPEVTVVVEIIEGDCTPNVAGISPPPKLIKLNTYTVTDGSAAVATGDTTGNIATCVQRIEIVDTHGPLIVSCPASVPGCVGVPLVFTPPTCSDTCGTCSVVCTRSDGLPLGDPVSAGLTIVCTAADECANASSPCVVSMATEDCDTDIPTVSQWGLVVLTLLLLIGAKLRFSREHSALAH